MFHLLGGRSKYCDYVAIVYNIHVKIYNINVELLPDCSWKSYHCFLVMSQNFQKERIQSHNREVCASKIE
jgi:hypothetical protein